MMRAVLAAATLMLPLPTLAADIFLTIDNQSSQSAAFNSYPIDGDGEPIEDNIGAYSDILPGTKGRYKLDISGCAPVLVTVILADSSEMQTDIDTCKARTLVISD